MFGDPEHVDVVVHIILFDRVVMCDDKPDRRVQCVEAPELEFCREPLRETDARARRHLLAVHESLTPACGNSVPVAVDDACTLRIHIDRVHSRFIPLMKSTHRKTPKSRVILLSLPSFKKIVEGGMHGMPLFVRLGNYLLPKRGQSGWVEEPGD